MRKKVAILLSGLVRYDDRNYEFLKNGIYDLEVDKGQIGSLSDFVTSEFKDNRQFCPVFNHVDIKKNFLPVP